MKKIIILYLMTFVLLLTSCRISDAEVGMIEMETTQVELATEEYLADQFRQTIYEETGLPVCRFYYNDNQADEEVYAFVFAGDESVDGEGSSFQGELWYIDEMKCMLLTDNIETSKFEPTILDDTEDLLFCTTSGLPDSGQSYIWSVVEQEPHLVWDYQGYCFEDNGLLAWVKTSISYNAAGRIWQRYYLYWDNENGSYQIYLPERIREEDYLSYRNAQTARDQIQISIMEYIKSYEAVGEIKRIERDYLRCDNGIIYINFKIISDRDTFYYYAILREREGAIIMEERQSYEMFEMGYMYHNDDLVF